MGGVRKRGNVRPVVIAGLLAVATAALPGPAAADDAGGQTRPTLKLRVPPSAAMPMPRSLPMTNPAARQLAGESITAHACAPCASPEPEPRPLIAALPPGESYELRILKSAVSGFRLRASEASAPASADERLRIRISRQQVSVSWQMSF